MITLALVIIAAAIGVVVRATESGYPIHRPARYVPRHAIAVDPDATTPMPALTAGTTA